jgi:hypothetical protein
MWRMWYQTVMHAKSYHWRMKLITMVAYPVGSRPHLGARIFL